MVIQEPIKGIQAATVAGGKEFQLAGLGRMADHRLHTSGQSADHGGDIQQASHDHGDLDEIQNGNGKHAAERRIGQDDHRTDHHPDRLTHCAARDDVQH